ncbi:hypothetical protein [Christiangramia portivictoriae]|uniref:hypothetical protein n=1 Tax=Christiangramia portivictoriae TaxID=326069 RepID=UPI0003FDD26D|nr:hypothetical protein [Christiangramia portivictoriae]
MNISGFTLDKLKDGIMATDLRQSTSINFINTLRNKQLIYFDHKGRVYLTNKGKIANKLGFQRYLKLERDQQELLEQELETIQVENRGLLMIFSGMIISLLLIIAFWVLELQSI